MHKKLSMFSSIAGADSSTSSCGTNHLGGSDEVPATRRSTGSLFERRFNSSSSDAPPLPLTTFVNSDDVVVSNATGTYSSYASPMQTTGLSSTRARARNAVAGRSIGTSIVAVDRLNHEYDRIVKQLHVLHPTVPSGATSAAEGCDVHRAPPLDSVDALVARMDRSALVEHCMALHAVIQRAVSRAHNAGHTQSAAAWVQCPTPQSNAAAADASYVRSAALSSRTTVDAVGGAAPAALASDVSFAYSLPAALGVSAGLFHNPSSLSIPETPAAALQHSLSTMSISNAEPVQITNEMRKSRDEDGAKLINDYVVLDKIGKGSFGKVKLAFDPHNCRMVAIKVVRKPSLEKLQQVGMSAKVTASSSEGFGSMADLSGDVSDASQTENMAEVALRRRSLGIGAADITKMEALQREVAVMKKLRHKHIVSLYEVIDDPETEKLYLVMQYIDDGSIGSVRADYTCDRVDPIDLLSKANHILAGLQYLHARGIVHRDIKPENILVNKDGEAFLADFGVSEMFEKSTAASVEGQRGTRLFLAPELLQESVGHDTSSSVRGKGVDVWALGVTLYALLVGRLPFQSVDDIQNPALPSFDEVPALWKPILERMLQKAPKNRISAFRARQMIKAVLTAREEQPHPEGSDELEGIAALNADDVISAFTPIARRAQHPLLHVPSMSMSHLSAQQQQLLVCDMAVVGALASSIGGGARVLSSQPPPSLPPQRRNTAQPEAESSRMNPRDHGTTDDSPPSLCVTNRAHSISETATLPANTSVSTSSSTSERLSGGHHRGVPMIGSGAPVAQTVIDASALLRGSLPPSSTESVSSSYRIRSCKEAAGKELTKYNRRLTELLSEQRQVDTERLIAPKGIPSGFRSGN